MRERVRRVGGWDGRERKLREIRDRERRRECHRVGEGALV
jgi:hypothetical protein